jgi:hypothetical protein
LRRWQQAISGYSEQALEKPFRQPGAIKSSNFIGNDSVINHELKYKKMNYF